MDSTDKKYLRRLWRRFRVIRPAILIILLSVSIGVSALALRSNNANMTQLRSAVFAADEQNGDVEGALHDLREYIYSHMNTDLNSGDNTVYPPIQLKYTYERLVEAEQAKVAVNNEAIYTQAQRHCEKLYPGSFSGGPRVPCIQQYIEDHGVKTNEVPDGLYKFDFVSPVWSPDLAGFSVLASILLGALLVVRLIVPAALKALKVI